MRPRVFGPTGTEIGAPVLSTPDPALQAVGGAHRDGAHHPVADLLLHFQGQAVLDLERVIDLGHRRARKLRVHDGPDDFDDVSVAHVRLPGISAESVAAVDEPRSDAGCSGNFLGITFS